MTGDEYLVIRWTVTHRQLHDRRRTLAALRRMFDREARRSGFTFHLGESLHSMMLLRGSVFVRTYAMRHGAD